MPGRFIGPTGPIGALLRACYVRAPEFFLNGRFRLGLRYIILLVTRTRVALIGLALSALMPWAFRYAIDSFGTHTSCPSAYWAYAYLFALGLAHLMIGVFALLGGRFVLGMVVSFALSTSQWLPWIRVYLLSGQIEWRPWGRTGTIGLFTLSTLVGLILMCVPFFCTRPGSFDSRCCAKCGYDLRFLPEPRCPECGTPFRQTVETDQMSRRQE